MSEQELTHQQKYTALAENYCSFKKNTLLNMLHCGKILVEAKQSLEFGEFQHFLEDSRVNESLRTSQRLMAVYKDYRHILSHKDKIEALKSLGISHLLELRKLPDRFKKEIEIVKESEGKEIKEMVSVVDEDKLNDFLGRTVPTDDGSKHIRDLPLFEMKKYINDASGIYELSKEEQDEEMSKSESELESIKQNVEESIKTESSDEEARKLADQKIAETTERVMVVLTQLGDVYAMSTQAMAKIPEIMPEDLYSNGELIRTKLKVQLEQSMNKADQLKSVCETLLYKIK